MIWDAIKSLACIFRHRYVEGRFFNPNLQFFEYGRRCVRCRHTVID